MLTYILKLFPAKAVHESRIMKVYDSASIKLLEWNTSLISLNRKYASSLCEIKISHLKDIICLNLKKQDQLKPFLLFLCNKDRSVFIEK